MLFCQSFIYVSLLSWRMLKTLTCSSLWFSSSNTRSKWLLCVLIHFWQLIILYAAFVCCRIQKCAAFMRNTVSHVQQNYVPQHDSSVSFQFLWLLHQFYKLCIFILSNIQRNEFCFIYTQTDRDSNVLQQIYTILSATWGGRIALACTGNTWLRSTIYCTKIICFTET